MLFNASLSGHPVIGVHTTVQWKLDIHIAKGAGFRGIGDINKCAKCQFSRKYISHKLILAMEKDEVSFNQKSRLNKKVIN